MSMPRGEGGLGAGGEPPHGAAPNLDGIPGSDDFTSPDLNPDGDWIRLEQEVTPEQRPEDYGYSFSVFKNRFRVRRASGRDETVRKEVRRDNRRTREIGDGMCVTEEDVTYENRLRRAYILDQAYDYYIVDGRLEAYYEFFNSPEVTLGGMAMGTGGAEVASGFALSSAAATATGAGAPGATLIGGSGAVVGGGAATVGVTLAGALLVGGATFISFTQGMSEWKSASKLDHSGWMPIMWYFERDSLPSDPDPLTVTEIVSIHPCSRPVTGSPSNLGHDALHSPTPIEGLDPIDLGPEADDLPTLPLEEGDIAADPEVGTDPDHLPEDVVPEIGKPPLQGDGEDRRSPAFEPEADWYRDLGQRGGYYFVVQYLNKFREVPDLRFDRATEQLTPTNRKRTIHLGDGMCQEESEHEVRTVRQWATRVDQAYQVWRVDSAEAVTELKRALREAQSGDKFTMPTSPGPNTASTAAGHSAETHGMFGDWLGDGVKGAGVFKAASFGFAWIGNVINILGLPTAPVPAGAGWAPVAFYLSDGEAEPGAELRWVPVGPPHPCPSAPEQPRDEDPFVVSLGLSWRDRGGAGLSVGAQYIHKPESSEIDDAGDGRSIPLWPWLPVGVIVALVLAGLGFVLRGGNDTSDETSDVQPAGKTDAETTDGNASFSAPMTYPIAAGAGLTAISPMDAADIGSFAMGGPAAESGAPVITGGEIMLSETGLTFSMTFDPAASPTNSTLRSGLVLVADDGGVVLEASAGVVEGTRVDGAVTVFDGLGGRHTWDARGMLDGDRIDIEIDMTEDVPTGWAGADLDMVGGYGFVDLPPLDDDAAFLRDSSMVAGELTLSESWLPVDPSLMFMGIDEYRVMEFVAAGASPAVAECLVDDVTPGEEAAAAFRPEQQAALILPCLVQVEFASSPTAAAAAAGAAQFAPSGSDIAGCMALELSKTLTSVDQFVALSNPNYTTWPDGLLPIYAAALEICVRLRPFYEEQFAGFGPYTREGCVADMTNYVLATYNWEVFILEGILDPDPQVRQLAQSIFDNFVNQGYGLQSCFQQG